MRPMTSADRPNDSASTTKAVSAPNRAATTPPRKAPRASMVLQVRLSRALAATRSFERTTLASSAPRAGVKRALRANWMMVSR